MREVGKRWHLGAIFSIGPVPFPLEKKVTLHTASQTCYILDLFVPSTTFNNITVETPRTLRIPASFHQCNPFLAVKFKILVSPTHWRTCLYQITPRLRHKKS